jgi:hypothetical protein
VTTGPARHQRPVIVSGQGIIVPVEHRQHGGYSTTGTGKSTAGNPSMLTKFFSR